MSVSPLRIALVAGGVLIAGGALFLLFQGLGGGAPALSGETGAPGAPSSLAGAPARGGEGKDKDGKEPPPAWQSFLRPDAPGKTVPRPSARLAGPVPSPFVYVAEAPPAVEAEKSVYAPLRLPAVQIQSAKLPPAALRLEGVAAGPSPLALISGKVVRAGDTIAGYRVVEVGKSGASLQKPGGARLELAIGATVPGSGS